MGSAFSRTAPQEEAVTQCHPAEDLEETLAGTQTHSSTGPHLGQKASGSSDGQNCQHAFINSLTLAEVPDTPAPAAEASPVGREGGSLVTNTDVTRSTRSKRKGAASTPLTNSKLQKRRKSTQNAWTYVGLQHGSPFDPEGCACGRPGWMQCPDGRWYPEESTMKEGDVPVSVYTNEEYDKDEEYEVEAILDERRRGTMNQYRVKWKGYQLDPKEFVKREALEDCEALDRWEVAQAAKS
ncbi:hypothetical protein COCOBI_04-7840 [Coccomyxa sp. Obi]|nr:hypothetical protein COCOBI_04-7840 [Coccomyxa sp. Obi]